MEVGLILQQLLVIIAITAGKSAFTLKAIKQLLKEHKRKIVQNITKELTKLLGSMVSILLPAAIEIVFELFGTGIGDLIAKGLDYVDPLWKKGYQRNNGYILN